MFRAVPMTSNVQHATPPANPGSQPFVMARVGRKDAVLTSVEGDGLTCTHPGPLKVGSDVAFSIAGRGHTFSAYGTVASCRVAALSGGDGGATLFHSRLLLELTAEARATLQNLLEGTR